MKSKVICIFCRGEVIEDGCNCIMRQWERIRQEDKLAREEE